MHLSQVSFWKIVLAVLRRRMDFLKSLRGIEIGGNTAFQIAALCGILLAALVAGKILKAILERSAARLEAGKRFVGGAALHAFAKSAVFLCVAVGISLGIRTLEMGETLGDLTRTMTSILFTMAVAYLLYGLAEVPSTWFSGLADKTESKLDNMLVPIVRKALRFTVVVLALVQIAQILSDKPITSIIAGLGIGGLAVALAAQDTIKNIFGSIVLFIDKPFELGDRIAIDGHDGPVEEVGLRSTKIRTLDGHLVTIPNAELANKTIQNIGKRPYIRRVVDITLPYDTPPEKVDRAVEILKGILDHHDGMREEWPPRAYFSDFKADSLNIQVMYWYHPPNYWLHMAFADRFNREVLRRFNEEGIEFAFPTQTLYLAGDRNRPLTVGMNSPVSKEPHISA
jgi:MscS family membrane protein